MHKDEKIFYQIGFPEEYAKAYIEGDEVCFDIGQQSRGFACGGQIIRKFSKSYVQKKSFDDFLIDLDAVDIITSVVGEKHAEEVLDEMWKFLCTCSSGQY